MPAMTTLMLSDLCAAQRAELAAMPVAEPSLWRGWDATPAPDAVVAIRPGDAPQGGTDNGVANACFGGAAA